MKINKIANVAVAFWLLLGTMATETAQAISIDTVMVGDAGNAADPSTGSLYGAVSYTYNIGTYEVSLMQYTAFLNAVAVTDTYSLYNTNMATNLTIAGISRSGTDGSYSYSVIGSGNRPVTYVSWFDAARFANWMANGQGGAGTTETGAYTLNGATSGVGFTKNAVNPNTGQATIWWIPSEDEWYKAAYYSPGASTDSYWLYPTQSDSAPGNVVGATANQANYNNGVYSVTQNSSLDLSQNYLTDGGAFSNSASHYGTYDQGGNVWEWNDAVISGSYRGVRGGSWFFINVSDMQSSGRSFQDPTVEYGSIGFRVASVPEPSSGLLLLVGAGAAWLVKRRKGRD